MAVIESVVDALSNETGEVNSGLTDLITGVSSSIVGTITAVSESLSGSIVEAINSANSYTLSQIAAISADGDPGTASLRTLGTGSTQAMPGISGSTGDLLYNNGTDWVRLAAGTSGSILNTSGIGTAPTWEAAASSTNTMPSIFGDGSDGDVTLGAGQTALTRDMYYDTLGIPSGSILKTAGYRVFCATSCSVALGGIIQNSGSNGITSNDSYGGGLAGAAGILSGGANGGNGNGQTGGSAANYSLGGAGGAGGQWPGTGSLGNGGSAPAPVASVGGIRDLQTAIYGKFQYGTQNLLTGGAGGGGGQTIGNRSGAGGGGGGVLVLVTKELINNGSINTNGGDGGDGVNETGAGDGGGGGGGGVTIIIAGSITGAGTITANGGSHGLYWNGTAGGSTNGSAGTVIQIIP